MKESNLMKRIQKRATAIGARLFRNNVAKGWVSSDVIRFSYAETFRGQSSGSLLYIKIGDVFLRRPRRLHAGLAKGSSDLIGWHPVTITQEMVGMRVAVFTALEVKQPGKKPEPDQVVFLAAVNTQGGIGLVATSEDEAEQGLTWPR